MTTITKEFSDFQKRECDELPEEVLPPVICPTCTPNPNALVPIWYDEDEPFLNEKECLYQVAVQVNDKNEFLTPSVLRNLKSDKSSEDLDLREALGETKYKEIIAIAIEKGFLRQGIRELLRYYEKLEANCTVCAYSDCTYDPNETRKWTTEQEELLASIDSDPMGDPYEGNQWEYQIAWKEDAQAYQCFNYTNMQDWGTSTPQPRSGSHEVFQTPEEVIDWIKDMTHAATEFAVSHELVPKGDFGYANPGPEYTER